MNVRIFAIAAVVALASVGVAQRRENKEKSGEAPAVLQLAVARQAKLKYTGKRVVEFLRNGVISRHEELLYRDGPNLRIEFGDAGKFAGQIIVENGRERRQFFPETNEIRVSPPRREESFARLERMMRGPRGVRFEASEGDTVAARRTELIKVKDQRGNLLQQLNIDPQTGLVLRRRLYDPTGAQFGFFEFLTVDLAPGKISGSLFRLVRNGATVRTPFDELRKATNGGRFTLAYLPKKSGFVLDNVREIKMEGRAMLVQVYTGTEGRVSLFQIQGDVEQGRLSRMSRGRMSTVTWSRGGTSFVLAGTLPKERLDSLIRLVVSGSNP